MKKEGLLVLTGAALLFQGGFSALEVHAEETVEVQEVEKEGSLDVNESTVADAGAGEEEEGYGEVILEKRDSLLQLDKEMLVLKQEISTLNEELKKEKLLNEKKQELKEKEIFLKERFEDFGDKLALWQMEGTPESNFLDVLLGAESFSDMISKTFAYKTLLDADNAQIEAMMAEKEQLEKDKIALQEEVDLLKLQKKASLEKEKELNEKKTVMQTELEQLEEKELQRIMEEIQAQELRKKELLEKALTEETLAELKTLMDSTGINAEFESLFIRPAQGRLTSKFGPRSNPFGTGAVEFHSGIDIANPTGTPILATADGEVVTATPSRSGYGNFVKVKHEIKGETFYSVYAHLSLIGVSVGEQVKQGEVVGLMGSTGRSTGPHLHFEIQNENKTAMNPEIFIDKKDKKTKEQLEKEAELKKSISETEAKVKELEAKLSQKSKKPAPAKEPEKKEKEATKDKK